MTLKRSQVAVDRPGHTDSGIPLTPSERQILAVLEEAGGRVVRRGDLARDALGLDPEWYRGWDLVLRAHVHNLRPKLAARGLDIRTERGLGYALRSAAAGRREVAS